MIGQPIVVRCEVKNQTKAYEDPHEDATETGGSFMISLVVHDGMFTVIRRVNICRVSLKG